MSTNSTLIQQIIEIAAAARNEGQSVRIDNMLPSVDVVRGEDDEYFFQEHSATEVIAQAKQIISDLGEEAEIALDVEDVLLYQAQSW